MEARTRDEYLALIRSVLPEDLVDGLLAGSGGELYRALAAVGERLSLAVVRTHDGLQPGLASLGSYAEGTVTLDRTGTTAGSLPVGAVLWDRNGEACELLDAATWEGGDTATKTVRVRSRSRSWQANLAAGTVLGVRAAGAPSVDVVLWDPTVVGRVASPGLTGGEPPDLQVLGWDRNVSPLPEESAEAVRDRYRAVADTISLAALRRHATAVIPGAQVHNTIEFATFALTGHEGWYAGGLEDLAAVFAGDRVFGGDFVLNRFQVLIPPDVAPPTFMCCGEAGYPYLPAAGFDAAAPVLTALGSDGTPYDIGQPGYSATVARLGARIEDAKGAAEMFGIEESASL